MHAGDGKSAAARLSALALCGILRMVGSMTSRRQDRLRTVKGPRGRAVPLLAAIAATLWGLLAVGCSPPGGDGPIGAGDRFIPEAVILISIDTLRADRLGSYGYARPTSPHLDAFARESVRFETVLAQSTFTLISHKSLFAGKYPLHLIREGTGADLAALAAFSSPYDFLVSVFGSAKVPLLIGGLREHGYRTAAFTDGVWMSAQLGFDRGFDTFNEAGGNLVGILPRVYRWLERGGDRPFFLFVHTYDTHSPYATQEPFDSIFCGDHQRHLSLGDRCNQIDCGAAPLMQISLSSLDLRAISDHYDGGIAFADAYLGQFFARLRALGRFEEALIIVTSDHGESLGEHGQVGHGGLYLEQLLVPLIIKLPRSWNVEPAVIDRPVELVDVMPTVYEALGIQVPHGLDGRSLVPLIRGGVAAREYLVAQTTYREGRDSITNPAKRALLEPGRWLLIHDGRSRSLELYDLRADRLGLTPVEGSAARDVEELLDLLAARDAGAATGGVTDPEPLEFGEDLKRRLRSLGYVGN